MILLDTLQGIRREIGSDPELMEALEAVTLTVAQMAQSTPPFMMPYRCICSCGKQTNYSVAKEVKAVTCQDCAARKWAKEHFGKEAMAKRKQELARQAEERHEQIPDIQGDGRVECGLPVRVVAGKSDDLPRGGRVVSANVTQQDLLNGQAESGGAR